MALNHWMHERNPYKLQPPDFAELAVRHAALRRHCTMLPSRKVRFNFADADAVRCLATVLLKEHFDLDVCLPPDSLVPRIPQRLNYVLWVEDLLKVNRTEEDVVGIDIGTGASCIYPLLGTRHCGWSFVATELDEQSALTAEENIARNNLQDKIRVQRVRAGGIFHDVFEDALKDRSAAFCMCNPPFFTMDESEEKFMEHVSGSLRNMCRLGPSTSARTSGTGPRSATVAKQTEVYTEGGEVQFVSQIVDESAVLKDRIKIYTSMLGKKTSLAPLRRRIAAVGASSKGSTFNQGRTMRWALAWTFDPAIKLETPADTFQQEPPPTSSVRAGRKRRHTEPIDFIL